MIIEARTKCKYCNTQMEKHESKYFNFVYACNTCTFFRKW